MLVVKRLNEQRQGLLLPSPCSPTPAAQTPELLSLIGGSPRGGSDRLMSAQKWQKNENMFLGQNFRACPPPQIFTLLPLVLGSLLLRCRARRCPSGCHKCHRIGGALTRTHHTAHALAAASTHSPGGGKGSRIPGCPLHAPAYTVIFIITWSVFLAIYLLIISSL